MRLSNRAFGILATLFVFIAVLVGLAWQAACNLSEACDMSIYFDTK